jgi:hypothetical protein
MTTRQLPQPQSPDIRQEVMATVGRPILREFNVAFALMSLIPLCIGVYVLGARLFTVKIFEGMTGVYFFIAIAFALIGFVVGRRILSGVLAKLIDVSVQLRQHDVVKTAFIGNVAYELRPPLAAAHMSLKNLCDGLLGPLNDGQDKTVRECYRVVDRLVHLASDLIDVTGGAAASSQLQREVFDLQGAIEEVVRSHEPTASGLRQSIRLSLPQQPALFYGDRRKFVQAFGGLVGHAVRWSPEGGQIEVTLSSALEEWRLVVSHVVAPDAATAARPDQQRDPFLGLGVHLAKSIIELHHGRFWSEWRGGRTNQLVACLPVLEPPLVPSRDTPRR